MVNTTLKVELKEGWFKENINFKSKKDAKDFFKIVCKSLKNMYNGDFCYSSLFINKKDGSKIFLIDTF